MPEFIIIELKQLLITCISSSLPPPEKRGKVVENYFN